MISVIVPAYNSERWVEAAVRSVLSQSENDWELIIVDDGSTDRTGELCDSFAMTDSRIRVIHRDNGGLSVARNSGIDVARGEWITFLDADDVLAPYALQTLLETAHRCGADIVCSGMRLFRDKEPDWEALSNTKGHEKVLEPIEAVEAGLYRRGIAHTSASGRLYSAVLWRDIRFLPGYQYEDLEIFPRITALCTRYAETEIPTYGYRQHPESFMHLFSPKRLDVLKVTAKIEAWSGNHGTDVLKAARNRRIGANFNMFMASEGAFRRGDIDRERRNGIQQECYGQIKRLRRETLMNSKSRYKNRIGALMSYLGPYALRRLSFLVKA